MSQSYENVVLLHGPEGADAIRVLREQGTAAACEHLKGWYEEGEGTLVSTAADPWKPSDEVAEGPDGFVVYWNEKVGYIGLVLKLGLGP